MPSLGILVSDLNNVGPSRLISPSARFVVESPGGHDSFLVCCVDDVDLDRQPRNCAIKSWTGPVMV
jgi:hypothetical protein